MVEFLIVLTIIVIAKLVLVSAISIAPSEYSDFELERRAKLDDAAVQPEQDRAQYFTDLISLQRALAALFLVLSVALLVATCGWLVGVLLAVLLALEYGALSRIPLVHRLAQKYYDRYEPHIVALIKKYPKAFSLLRSLKPTTPPSRLHSREELLHQVAEADRFLSTDEKLLIKNGLEFGTRLVSEVMTPRSVINTVKKGEILGPLVLNDLHKAGHSRFPVIDGDVDHVVGVLHLRDLLTLDTNKKHTAKVETAMDSRVFYIHEDQNLQHALAAFLKTHHHLFIVVNQYRETAGLLSLEDVIEAMLGRKIVDEFDAHEDLRAVALRNPRGNNASNSKSKNV